MDFAQPDYIAQPDNTNLDHIPGSYGLPIIGDTFGFVVKPFETLDRRYRKYGPVSKMSMTFQKSVIALGPEFIQQLTLDSEHAFSAQMGYDAPLGDFFAGGLLMKDFKEHKFHRRIMQTAPRRYPWQPEYTDPLCRPTQSRPSISIWAATRRAPTAPSRPVCPRRNQARRNSTKPCVTPS